jgi:hypothetical protein
VFGTPWQLILGDLCWYSSSLLVTFQNSSTDNPFCSYVPHSSGTDDFLNCIFILSYHSLSYPIPSYILSYHILSYPIVSYPIISFPIVSYHIPSYPIISYPILSYPIPWYPIISFPIISFPIISYPIISFPILSSVCVAISLRVCSCSNNYLIRVVHWRCKNCL